MLKRFLFFTKESNYFIREVFLHGPGEPTLWKNINEGIRILHDFDRIGLVGIVTNGASLELIEEKNFDYIDV